MTDFLIGCGGWAYFQIPGLRSLDAYSRAFNFVEVNSTFYRIPSLKLAESWRRKVPTDFEFAVRCHRDVTHKYQLEPVQEAFNTLDAIMKLCQILNSRFLVLETPVKLRFNDKKIKSIKNFFESIDMNKVTIIWEVRHKYGEPIPQGIVTLMQDYGIVHCVDFSKESPSVDSDVVYTRLFGKGERNVYQFSDEELTEIDGKITKKGASRTVMSFHNVRMYKDAARFKIFKQTGKWPSVTGTNGQQSLRKVLTEDVRLFPVTKSELLKTQGWKVLDLTTDKKVHVHTLLNNIPNKQYKNVDEILNCVKEVK